MLIKIQMQAGCIQDCLPETKGKTFINSWYIKGDINNYFEGNFQVKDYNYYMVIDS